MLLSKLFWEFYCLPTYFNVIWAHFSKSYVLLLHKYTYYLYSQHYNILLYVMFTTTTLACHLPSDYCHCSSATESDWSVVQVAFNHPASPPSSTHSGPRHLKIFHSACTAAYQPPTTNKHHRLGRSQRTTESGAAAAAAGGGGGEVERSCIKSKGWTCGATLTETLHRSCVNLWGRPARHCTGEKITGSLILHFRRIIITFAERYFFVQDEPEKWIYTFLFPCYQWCTPGFCAQVTSAERFSLSILPMY